LSHISPRSLIDFERGVGNPTLSTLEALLKPFNLQLTIGIKERKVSS
jgi:transcriptional regulator with XRE-family HTH domain